MQRKSYKIPENTPTILNEPAVAYRRTVAETSPAGAWNPNIPFHGTQDEWWEHFHRIEEGEFMTLEEFDRKFATWKEKYLANKLK